MARKFEEPRKKMSPAARARAKQRARTLAAGAVIERSLVRSYIKRQMAKHPKNVSEPGNESSARVIYQQILDWLKAQPARTKRKGGIGRR